MTTAINEPAMDAKLNCNFMAGADGFRQLDDVSPRVATVEGNRDVSTRPPIS